MTIEALIFSYAVIFAVLLAAFIWLWLRQRANKARTSAPPSRQPINWKSLLAFRPQEVLTGEMWLKSSIAAFIALCAGVIIVVFVFPLGAAWAAFGAFVAALIIVALLFTLLD